MRLNEADWQMLAAKVATETDPKRLMELLDNLIQALDQRREALRKANPEKTGNRSTNGAEADD
jgi:hypothetical protein